ncbi:MAG: hypothetical protein KY461_01760 [Actinobacteria bacterium]|nr:hypothetical protein [Actinomycetota bacterium]
MSTTLAAAGTAAVALAAVHLLARRFEEALGVVPRNRWLSVGGGISVAYVFLHLLPEMAAVEDRLDAAGVSVPWIEGHGWVAALAGLVVFHGLEQHARRARETSPGSHSPDPVGWIHVGSYGLYNAIAGAVLVREAAEDTVGLVLYTVAVGLHFLVNDAALVEDHGRVYRRAGRWIVAGGVLAGWAVAGMAEPDEAAVAVLAAFLGGGILMNVLKEELPDQRRSRFGVFLTATVAFAALLLVV